MITGQFLKATKTISFLEQNSEYVISYSDSLMINGKGFKISDSEVGTENLKIKRRVTKGALFLLEQCVLEILLILKQLIIRVLVRKMLLLFHY